MNSHAWSFVASIRPGPLYRSRCPRPLTNLTGSLLVPVGRERLAFPCSGALRSRHAERACYRKTTTGTSKRGSLPGRMDPQLDCRIESQLVALDPILTRWDEA